METGALIAALQALAPAATPAALRRVLHALIDDEAIPDTATPPVSSDGAAGRLLDSPDVPEAAPSRLAERTTRPPSRIHPARDPGAPSKGSNADRDWLRLREQVRTEQARRGLDRAELARVLGLAASTLGKTLNHRTAPSRPITDRLTRFVADLGATPVAKGVQTAGPGEDGAGPSRPPTPSPRQENGQGTEGVGGEDPIQELAKRLRRKRRPLPLTSTSLAASIGVEPDELDNAIHGKPVPPQARLRLEAWAAAG